MGKLKVLVIHGDNEIRKGIYNILSHFNLEFMYAADGLDGLAAAKYDYPDLIFCGTELAVLDGLSLGRMLKNDEVTKSIPLIFLDNGINFDHLKDAKIIEAKAFLMKPYLDNTLIYAVMRVFNKDQVQISDSEPDYEKSIYSRRPVCRVAV